MHGGVPRDQLSLHFSAAEARRAAGLEVASLNRGPGPRRCRCAADDAGFQAYFAHAGFGGGDKFGSRRHGRPPE